jgi:pantothenate synthetase
MRESIDSTEGAKIDYIALVDYETLKPVRTVQPGTLIALAVRVGRTRLIDNTLIGPSET